MAVGAYSCPVCVVTFADRTQRLFLLVLHKDRGRRADAVKKAAPNVRFDLSE